MAPQAEPKVKGIIPHRRPEGLCARRRVSEANRTTSLALRPEMAGLPRNFPQMANNIYARPGRRGRRPLRIRERFAIKLAKGGKEKARRRGQVTPAPTGKLQVHHKPFMYSSAISKNHI